MHNGARTCSDTDARYNLQNFRSVPKALPSQSELPSATSAAQRSCSAEPHHCREAGGRMTLTRTGRSRQSCQTIAAGGNHLATRL